jgi:CubicO group peptidase (beta-lactamase class C family)
LNSLSGKTFALCAAALPLTSCTSSPPPEPASADVPSVRSDVTERIEAIERGLLPPVIVAGEAPNRTIEERMREYRIPALSIAVFDNYELQWAKAYGMADGEAGSRATGATLFLAGAISKSVNALGVMLAAADATLAHRPRQRQ